MKTKKIVVLLLALLLALAFVGCVAESPQPPPPPQIDEPPVEVDEVEDEIENEIGRYELSGFSDRNVFVTLYYNRRYHTQEHIIGLSATITNIGEERVVFQVGSGSNRVPDALQVSLEPFTALFRPAIQTNDMQHHVLLPGESVTFELPFAPYRPANAESEPMIGFVEDLEFFQNEEWVLVPIGEYTGTVTFNYVIRDEGEADMISEGDEQFTVEGRFQLILLADEAWPEYQPATENGTENGEDEDNE